MAVRDVVGRVNNFSAFADASVSTVLGAAMTGAQRVEARTLDHMLFLNRGDHFEARSLPTEAQWAPAFAVNVADLDGDGAEDVFLGQNFFPTSVGIPRYDAGRGLVLRGDGRGGLRAMSGQASGVAVYGDQRGAALADFNADGRLDLAVTQNGDSTRLFINRGATPGLRVRVSGGATNPDGVGAQVRLVYGTRMGPVHEVQAGAGYWSQNGAVQVLAMTERPTAVWVRWPGGRVAQISVPTDASTVTLTKE
jgi:hypothetical protein